MRQLCWHEAWISIWRRRRPFKIKFSEFESVNNLLINDVSVPKTQLEDKWNIHFTSSWFISKFKAALEEEKVERCSVKLVQMIDVVVLKIWNFDAKYVVLRGTPAAHLTIWNIQHHWWSLARLFLSVRFDSNTLWDGSLTLELVVGC